jgi:hypothetical protein
LNFAKRALPVPLIAIPVKKKMALSLLQIYANAWILISIIRHPLSVINAIHYAKSVNPPIIIVPCVKVMKGSAIL